MRSRSLTQMPDATQSLVSCVDKAPPAVTPKLVISADNFDSTVNAAKVKVGEEINMKITVTDSATNKPLPYRYLNVYRATSKIARIKRMPILIAGISGRMIR